jgi:hypothetical protein
MVSRWRKLTQDVMHDDRTMAAVRSRTTGKRRNMKRPQENYRKAKEPGMIAQVNLRLVRKAATGHV